jgi:hypothetical protein
MTMDESRIETLRESSPEATSADARPVLSQGVKAWGPFRNGKFYVNVGFAEYTPEQALRLAIEIVECAMVAAQAQREHDHGVAPMKPAAVPPWQVPDQPAATEQDTARRAAAGEAAQVAGTMWAAAADHAPLPDHLRDVPTGDHAEPRPPMAGPQPGPRYGE